MNKILLTLCLLFAVYNNGVAQVDTIRVDSFLITPTGKISDSRYNAIQFLDNRGIDTADLGFIAEKNGASKFISYVIQPKISLSSQFSHIINSVSSFADTGKILIQLANLQFKTNGYLQKVFSFKADLYYLSPKGYCKQDAIDTTVVIKARNSKNLSGYYEAASNIVCSFIYRNLTKQITDCHEYLTFNEIQKIDSVNKRKITLYSSDTLTEGVYTTYESLKNQEPEYNDFEVKIKDGILKKVERVSHTAEEMDYSFPDMYAVVTGNKIFLRIDSKYYPLEKRNNDFYFTRRIDYVTNRGPETAGQALILFNPLAGALGRLAGKLLNGTTKVTYEFKVNYTDGSFIPVKKIKEE